MTRGKIFKQRQKTEKPKQFRGAVPVGAGGRERSGRKKGCRASTVLFVNHAFDDERQHMQATAKKPKGLNNSEGTCQSEQAAGSAKGRKKGCRTSTVLFVKHVLDEKMMF